MLFGHLGFLSEINRFWICSVVGEKGSCKDLLVTELAAENYLRYGWKFYSNQYHLFNDPLYKKISPYGVPVDWHTGMAVATVSGQSSLAQYLLTLPKDGLVNIPCDENQEFYIPDVRRRVVSLTEAGRYLREYKYFEDLFEFARKVKNVFFFPSDRASHIDLMRLHCYPIVRFDQLFGFKGGLWGYNIDTGYTKRRTGKFIFLPTGKYTGVYDTEDFSESPDVLISAVRKEIEIEQNKRGRNGLSAMGAVSGVEEMDALITYQRNIYQANLSLLREAKKPKRPKY